MRPQLRTVPTLALPTLALLALALLAAAPDPAAAQVRIGARGGFNRAKVEAETGAEPADAKLGWIGGAYVEGGLTGRFGWHVSAQYSQKGIHEEVSSQAGTAELDWAMDYVEVPVMLQYLVQAYGPLALVLYGGGAPSFLVGCDSSVTIPGEGSVVARCGERFEGTTIEVQRVKDFDVTGIAGVSITASFGSLQVSGEGFYGLGLLPFVDEDPLEADEEPDLKHRVYSFTLGVSLPFGGGAPSPFDF